MVKWEIILLFLSISLYANDSVFLKAGEKAPYDGFLLTEARVEAFKKNEDKISFIQGELDLKNKLCANLEKENSQLKSLNFEYENNIHLLTLKLTVYTELSDLYKEKAEESFKLSAELTIYKLSTSIFIGVSIAELLGFGGFVLAYYIKDRIQ